MLEWHDSLTMEIIHHGDCNYVSMSQFSFPSVSINCELYLTQRMHSALFPPEAMNEQLQRVANGIAVD